MNVKLVSITKSHVVDVDLSPEELIVYVARVSNPSNQKNKETADRLLNYLAKHKHWSPFEMVDMTVEIVTSRGIAQQILRHRSFSFQEFSQRYSKVAEIEPLQLRYQADKNRQSSTDDLNESDAATANQLVTSVLNRSQFAYNKLLEMGVAKECARGVLPINAQTTMYMKGSIRSWIHYLQIRCDEHVQKEHRDVAEAIKSIFKEKFPLISKGLDL